MWFTVGTREMRADVTREETFISQHTGAVLRRVDVLVRASERNHQAVMDLLKEGQDQGITSIEVDGRSARWTVKQNSYSYSNESDIRTYQWSLEESEELRVEKLVLGELELTPYQYEEEIKDDALVIKARFRLSVLELASVRALMREGEYFPVIREGVNLEPKPMRLGRGLWSQDGDEVKQELILVDQAIDERKKSSGRDAIDRLHLGPANVAAMLTEKASMLDELLEVLVEKAVLSEADRNRIDQATPERAWRLRVQFERVHDLDEWNL